MTDLQKRLIAAAQRVEKTMNEQPFTCLYPGCSELPIRSHSQQEGGSLKTIQREGKVYTIRRRMETTFVDLSKSSDCLPPVCLTPISRATTFSGFCNRHDTDLFSCLENVPHLIPGNMEQVVALYRRSIAFAVANRRFNLNQMLGMAQELPEIKDNPALKGTIINWGIMLKYDMACTFQPSFDSDAAERFEFIWRVIPRNIGISCASGIPPLDDEAGDKLVGELIDYSTGMMKAPRPIISFNVVPENDRTHVVLIWDKQFLPYVNDVRASASSFDKDVIELFFNDALLNRSEDFTMSPDLWEGLSDSVRNTIRELIIPEHMREKVEVPRLVSLDDIGPVVNTPLTA